MINNTKSKWQKSNCTECNFSFVIHEEWLNPPKLCKSCQLVTSDLMDAIDTILNTLYFKPNKYEAENLSKLVKISTDPTKIDLAIWKHVKFLLSKVGLINEIDSFFIGINIDTIDHLINKFVRKKITKSSKSEIVGTLYEIHDLLNTKGKYRKKLINNNLAREISFDNKLFKIVKRAIKFNGKFSKESDEKIRKRNGRRSELIIDGKRRL